MLFRKKKKIVDSDSLNEKAKKESVIREIEEQIIQSQLNSIVIQPNYDSDQKIPVGSSKIGGKPDLPPNFEWFYYQDKSLNTEIKMNRPLSFLAQFNMEEIKKFDLNNKLPNTGILYFFYEMESNKWGFDPADRGCARVFYFNGCQNDLVSTDWPNELSDEFIFPEIGVTFSSKINIPDYEELIQTYEGLVSNSNINLLQVYEVLEKKGFTQKGYSSKLLGYSDNIQGDMTLDCQLVSNGLYCGDASGYHSPKRKELEADKNQWKLLFQLESMDEGKMQLYFGDMGRLYFFIKEADLINGNFDDIWFSLQCT